MNQLYPFVEQAFRTGSQQAILRLLTELTHTPGDKSEHLGLPANAEYAMKRLLGASLSKQPNIKFNAFIALSALVPQLKEVRSEALYEHIAALSDYNKHCEGKATEIEAYIIGKILIFKALRSIFAGHLNTINHLITVVTTFPVYEEQIIELISQLATDKKSTVLFLKFAPTTKVGFVLHALLKSKLKSTVPEFSQSVINDVLQELVAVYPKRSICIDYLGPQIKNFLQVPSQYLSHQLSAIFESDSEVNVRVLFYVLQILEGHLKEITITAENVWNLLDVKVLGGWILQLKVKNKHIRKIAEGISIQFDADADLAFKILSELHDKHLYLENINHKHPLYCLYENVEPHNYAKYLLGLIADDSNNETEEKEKHIGFYNELQVFLVVRHKELTIEEICQIITIFVNKYRQNSDESAVQALNTIFNALLPSNPKKTQSLHTRASLILSKLATDQLQLGEQQTEVRQAIKQIRNKFKANKQEKDVFNVAYYNFLLSVGFYFLIFPEEVDIFSDLEMVEKELKANILASQSGIQGKKKRKGENDKNKPIHVLVEIFIALLTKSSQFLRTTINLLFEQVIPFIDSTDIGAMLEAITSPESDLINADTAE